MKRHSFETYSRCLAAIRATRARADRLGISFTEAHIQALEQWGNATEKSQ